MNRRARKYEMQSAVEIASGVKLLGNRWKKGRDTAAYEPAERKCVYIGCIVIIRDSFQE